MDAIVSLGFSQIVLCLYVMYLRVQIIKLENKVNNS